MKKAYGSAALIVGALVLPGTPPAGAAEAKVLTAGLSGRCCWRWCPITSGNGEPCGGRPWQHRTIEKRIADGEAELGIRQISEIVPVKGAALVGPLPKEIQNTTTYAAGLSAAVKDKDAAKELIEYLSGADAAALLKSKGMEPAK